MSGEPRGPEVSVVIPVWGGVYRAALPRAIQSVRDAGGEARVLVVSRASEPALDLPEGVGEIRMDGALSVGAARNAGLAAVATPYVVFLDADDALEQGALPALRAALEQRPDAVAAVAQVRDRASGDLVAPRSFVVRLERRPVLLALANVAWSLLPMQGCTMVRADAATKAGGYADSDGGEDWALGVSLTLAGPVLILELPALRYVSSRDLTSVPSTRELRRRAGVARERWRGGATGPTRAALPAVWLAQLVVIHLLRPLALARQRAMAAQRTR